MAQHCRMLDRVHFDLRGHSEPIARSFGLDSFVEYFAMRVRTQWRIKRSARGTLAVWHDDGAAFSVHELGSFTGDSEQWLDAPKLVAHAAFPKPTVWRKTEARSVQFEAGKVYVMDVKFWQRWGQKGLKARPVAAAAGWLHVCCWLDTQRCAIEAVLVFVQINAANTIDGVLMQMSSRIDVSCCSLCINCH